MSRLELLKRLLPLLLGFVALYGGMVLLLRWIGLENAQQMIQQSGNWAPVLFVFLCAFSLIIAPLSGSSLFVIGGALFGKQTAFLLSLMGTVIGCSANFWISKKFGRDVVVRLIGKASLAELDKFTGWVTGHRGVLYLTLLMPLSQDIVSYAAGLTPISYSRFAIALIIGGTVIVAAYIYLGSSLLEALLK
jgi:uncharacterized membrane protein YdjX (TVP38/TMEM64 family)